MSEIRGNNIEHDIIIINKFKPYRLELFISRRKLKIRSKVKRDLTKQTYRHVCKTFCVTTNSDEI